MIVPTETVAVALIVLKVITVPAVIAAVPEFQEKSFSSVPKEVPFHSESVK